MKITGTHSTYQTIWRSVTCDLVLKMIDWPPDKVCFWLRGLYAILGDPEAVSGGRKKVKTGEKKIRAKKSQERKCSWLFFAQMFSPPFWLFNFPASTNCPWVCLYAWNARDPKNEWKH